MTDILDLVRQRILRSSQAVSYVTVGSATSNASLGTAVTLTRPSGANGILMSASGQSVRYTLEGSTPTANLGLLIPTGVAPVLVPLSDGMTLKVIETTASANLTINL